MDITVLFKACVKTIKTRNRAFGESPDGEKSKILPAPRSHGKSECAVRSREIVQQITRLRDFLSEHAKAYLNFGNLTGAPQMSDSERDKIDAGAKRIINACATAIDDFHHRRDATRRQMLPNQASEHRAAVTQLMKDYLKQVCVMYSEQRAIRVQRSVEHKKLMRINSNSPKKVNAFEGDGSGRLTYAPSPYLESEELSPEELQLFEFENNQLYEELESLSSQVEGIESKVMEISNLQEVFTEKVLEQDRDMDRILTTVMGTTENVKDANEQIRQAIQRNAGVRVYILFFLLIVSFSLLFLDWYND